MAAVKPIPEGAHTLTPNLVIRDCAKAIEFYKRALGAQELSRFPAPDGKSVWHAAIKVGNSTLYLNDEMPGMSRPPPSPSAAAPVTMWLWVEDADAAYRRAIEAGARSMGEPADMFWGDRTAGIADPYGYLWTFATHKKDMTPDEVRKAGEEFAKAQARRR